MHYPNFSKPFVLYTDASLVAAGAVLSQLDKKDLDNPIAYFSRTLNVHEQNDTVTEWECLAVLYGIQECRPYIYGSHFTVVTDHSSLKWLMNIKDPDRRVACWALKLQAYDYTIVHRPGTKHANTDCLSRLPMVALVAAEDETIFELIFPPHKWGEESKEVQKSVSKLAEDTVVE